jgi:hypothetical protein
MTRRPPGRPPLDRSDPSASVHVRLPARQFDELYRRAQHERTSMAAIIRRAISCKYPPDDGDHDD